ncbi:MAG: DNA alkylation response protein, partial [Candidatus Eremiobacteraeota bacterium]|nr:DNA alkylation response protein [Candidatus Eremiobacteraeota bacterium]
MTLTTANLDTHEVTNQPPALENYNLFETDPVLKSGIERYDGGWGVPELAKLGQHIGTNEFLHLGHLANRFPPELHTHDRFGHRIDRVEFHPSYHELMKTGVESGICAGPWREPKPGAQVVRAAKHFLLTQVEAGVECPMTMTYAAVPALRAETSVAAEWEPRILAGRYDPRFLPADQKEGVMIGMAMTEKQGGSDVRANTTRAVPAEGGFHLTGH